MKKEEAEMNGLNLTGGKGKGNWRGVRMRGGKMCKILWKERLS